MGWQARDGDAIDTWEEWRPFLLAARAARLDEVPWVLDPLDFRLVGQVKRAKRGPLLVYVHDATGGDLSVDDQGCPHLVKLDRAMRIRTKPIGHLPAVWRTGVPQYEMDREDEAKRRSAFAGVEWPDGVYGDDDAALTRHLRVVR